MNEILVVPIDTGRNETGLCMNVYITGTATVKAFAELIQRGSNLWPDAPPEIKALADQVTVGKVQQPYAEQAVDKHDIRAYVQYGHLCSCGYVTLVRSKFGTPTWTVTCNNQEIPVEIPKTAEDGTVTISTRLVPCKRTELFNLYQ